MGGLGTYSVALVASGGDLALSTADLGAGVLLSITPGGLLVGGDAVGVDGAALRDAAGEGEAGGAVAGLGSDKGGGKGRKKSRVQHCGRRRWQVSMSGCRVALAREGGRAEQSGAEQSRAVLLGGVGSDGLQRRADGAGTYS